MFRECLKSVMTKLDGYRDQWDDDYWDAIIASQVYSILPEFFYLSMFCTNVIFFLDFLT